MRIVEQGGPVSAGRPRVGPWACGDFVHISTPVANGGGGAAAAGGRPMIAAGLEPEDLAPRMAALHL